MENLKIYILLLLLIIACSPQDEQEVPAFNEYSVSESSIFLSPKTSDFIGRPTLIKAYDGGLYFTDEGFYRITKVDSDGNLLLSFGQKGQGPGELESIAGFWVFDNEYLVYDYNGFKFISYDYQGDLIDEKVVEENPVNPGFPPNIPITVHAISSHELLIPSGGRNGSLFAITNIETEEMRFAGKSIGKHIGSYNHEEVQEAYSKGEIPDVNMNLVILESSFSKIYSFQQTTGILEKFSNSGELIWEKNLKVPAQDNLFDQISRKNQDASKRGEPTQLFAYAKAMDANENGVAVLLNMTKGEPVTVAWVPDDGSRLDVITFPGLEQEELGFMGSLSVSDDDSRAYFLNVQDGIIYEAEWPI